MNMFISKDEICAKYDISHGRYLKYGKRVFEETGFKRRRGVNSIGKSTNIHQTSSGKYDIIKYIKGRRFYCGTYNSFNEAVNVRNYLIEHDWSPLAIERCMMGKAEL